MIASTAEAESGFPSLDLTELRELRRLGERFEAAWRGSGTLPPIEPFLVDVPESKLAMTERHLRDLAVELASAKAIPAPDRYRIGGLIGTGGMGVVYHAHDLETGQDVAIKQIRPELLACLPPDRRADLLARFEREGKLAAGVRHEHVITIYDIGTCDGVPYFTMRRMDGGTLADRLASGPLQPMIAAGLILPIAQAVAAAHRQNVTHRDIKPRNIFLDTAGVPYLGDFGLAKASGLEDYDELTISGMLVGTAPYMAPEQVRDSRRADALSDVYALGATLYRAITGRPPFQAPELPQILNQVLETEPVAPRLLQPGLPRDLERITLKCLAKIPADRYKDADALASDLQRFQDGLRVRARPRHPVIRTWRWAQRSPSSAGLAGLAVALVLGAGLGTSWWLGHRRAVKADTLIKTLTGARPSETPALLAGLVDFGPTERLMLAKEHNQTKAGTPPWFNLALGQARVGDVPPGLDYQLRIAPAEQVDAFVRGLPDAAGLQKSMQATLLSNASPARERLRAAAVLAKHDPTGRYWNATLGHDLTIPLLDEPPSTITVWAELLGPIAAWMADPLHEHLGDRSLTDSRRLAAAQVLAIWCAKPGATGRLVEAIARADGPQIRELAGALAKHPALMAELSQRTTTGNDDIQARARWAAALALAGRPEVAWGLMRHTPDNGVRSLLMIHLSGWNTPAELVMDRLESERDTSTRRALILTLGQYRMDLLPPHINHRATEWLTNAYRLDPDPGVHSAAAWTLGQAWKRPLPVVTPPVNARWLIEGGQTFAMVASGSTKPFAIGTHEVTCRDFYRLYPEIRILFRHRTLPADDTPIVNITHHQAVRFCERLTRDIGNGRTFRLATRTEWEEAAVAGARTARFYGEREEELDAFAWTVANSGQIVHRIGELRPNDLGLFDILGNISEFHLEPDPKDTQDLWPVRGGSFKALRIFTQLKNVSTFRFKPEAVLVSMDDAMGFRVVRELNAAEIEKALAQP